MKEKEQPYIFLIFEMLFLVFSIHINGFNGLFTLRNISILFIILMWVVLNGKIRTKFLISKIDIEWIIASSLLFIYIFIISFCYNSIGANNSALTHYINFFIMIVVLPYIFCGVEKNFDRFATALIIATVIQSFIVIASFSVPQIRTYLFQIQSFDDDFLSTRIVGLGIAGAKGSIYLITGFIINVYYLLFYKRDIKFILSAVIIFVATLLVGRTGFYVGLVLIVYLIFVGMMKILNKEAIKIFIRIIAVMVIICFSLFLSSKFISINLDSLSYTINRLSELWTTRRTFEIIAEMNVPILTIELLFWGHGFEKGYQNGIKIWHDSGYIQRYFSLGLLPAVFSYFILLRYIVRLIRCLENKNKSIFWLLIVSILVVIEYKEPFIYALALPFVIIVSLRLENNNMNKNYYD